METLLSFRNALSVIPGLMVWLLLFNISGGHAQVIVPFQSGWKYAPESNTAPAATWKTPGFNDASWKNGNAPFGFGNHFYNTSLQKGPNNTTPNYPAYYFRKTVNISSASAYSSVRLRAYLDDGIVIYINGVEVKRKNMNANPNDPYTGAAGDSLTIDTLLSTSLFQDGSNLISAEVHQTGSTSSDILFDLQLEGQTATLFRYPYLQLASHDQITVCWYTTAPTKATVRYSTNPDLEIYEEVSSAKNDTLHSVTLKKLNPDTKYYYNVGYYLGSEFRQLQYNPAVNYFHTLPSPADTSHSLRFWLLGDSGTNVSKNATTGKDNNMRPFKVRDAYLAYLNANNNPYVDGILFLGDNSNTHGYEGLQLALDTTLFRFYNRPNDQQLLSHIPSWTVMGNHDYGPSNYPVDSIRKAYHQQIAASFTTFAFPDSAQIGGEPTYNKKGYYSFDQGDVHFVVLNPYLIEGTSGYTYTDQYGYKEISHTQSIARNPTLTDAIDDQEQVKWLVKDLLRNQKKWTVVAFHLPPFSTIGHFPDSDNELARVQQKLLPILEKPEYHVDAVIVSHTHAYLRAGMIRKIGSQPRTTDYQQSGGLAGKGNLGRYPSSAPYIKSNNETAYTYILSGSAGRGFNEGGVNDGGYTDGDTNVVKHPSRSDPPLDNLTGDYTTGFYHVKGGSVELLFKENRLDVKFIKESDVSPKYFIADSFVVMKDVNKKTAITIQKGGDVVKLKASWIGEYNWYSSEQPDQLLTSGVRELTLGPNRSSTFFVRDQNGYLADTFNITVISPTEVVVNDTLIPFRSQWLFPLSAGFSTKGVKMNEQCILPTIFSAPAYELPTKTIIGLGHDDETYKLHSSSIERVFVPAEKLWFRRSFTLNGSVSTYSNFKITLLRDKNLTTRKAYSTSLQTIQINGQPVSIDSITSRDVANGREEVTYTLSNKGFYYGINYILVSYYLTPLSSSVYSMDASKDPFTFDAQLISTSRTAAPPPRTRQFKFAYVTLASQQVCAGDTVSVQFAAQGNETGFPLVYEAQLVTTLGDIPLAEGTESPILVRLPTNLLEGDYKIKVVTKSAFMDQLQSSEMHVKVLPKATIIPDSVISVWKGQLFSIPVKLEGGGPWNYVLSDGSTGTVLPTATAIEVKANRTHTYTINSLSNSCGVGQAMGSVQVEVKEPVLSVGKVVGVTSAPLKTALCDGDSVSVAYSVVGPHIERAYAVELSDKNGSFDTPTVLGNGNTNPLRMLFPTPLPEGDQYRIRMKAVNPDVEFTMNSSDPITIRQTAAGSFTLSKEAVLDNEELKLSLALTGTPPVYYFLRYGADTLRGSLSESVMERILTLRQTTVFALDSVRNVCGYGLVSGNRTVTVTLLVGVDPGSTSRITAYPNPSSELLVLKNNIPWKGKLIWRIYGANGRLMQHGTSTPQPNSPFTIDISSLPSGLYILGLTEEKHESTWRIIKR